ERGYARAGVHEGRHDRLPGDPAGGRGDDHLRVRDQAVAPRAPPDHVRPARGRVLDAVVPGPAVGVRRRVVHLQRLPGEHGVVGPRDPGLALTGDAVAPDRLPAADRPGRVHRDLPAGQL